MSEWSGCATRSFSRSSHGANRLAPTSTTSQLRRCLPAGSTPSHFHEERIEALDSPKSIIGHCIFPVRGRMFFSRSDDCIFRIATSEYNEGTRFGTSGTRWDMPALRAGLEAAEPVRDFKIHKRIRRSDLKNIRISELGMYSG